jgi:sterol desaturase/sphingolipid hydroxylase (fatty acid hydroxylase superfamily)
MDIILDGVFTSLFGGIAMGIVGYLFSNGLDEITILNISVVMFAWNLTGHLRHSHIWLSYGWALSHVFCSPAMHQIHHSNAERHIDKNLGFVFSFYDYLAGTLYVPREQEDLTWGLRNQEHKEYSGVWTLYVLPVKKAARLVLSGIKYA